LFPVFWPQSSGLQKNGVLRPCLWQRFFPVYPRVAGISGTETVGEQVFSGGLRLDGRERRGERSGTHSEIMTSKLYVGNLPFATTAQEVQDLFAATGAVSSVEMIFDKFTGRSRGFAFVNMTTPEDAQKIVEKYNGAELGGRNLTVNVAHPREERPARAFAGGGGNSQSGFRGSPRNERNYRR
jgi:cold-inducible RNA-binding protein